MYLLRGIDKVTIFLEIKQNGIELF